MADTPQAEFAARLRDSRQVWRDLVAEVGDRVDDAGPMGAWTFGDLAGHLLAWRNRSIARLEAAGRGEPEPPSPMAHGPRRRRRDQQLDPRTGPGPVGGGDDRCVRCVVRAA